GDGKQVMRREVGRDLETCWTSGLFRDAIRTASHHFAVLATIERDRSLEIDLFDHEPDPRGCVQSSGSVEAPQKANGALKLRTEHAAPIGRQRDNAAWRQLVCGRLQFAAR